MQKSRSFIFIGLALFLFCCHVTFAQTGPDLLVKPWDDGQYVDTSTDGLLEADAHSDGPADVRMSLYHSMGRYRILPFNVATPRLGYELEEYDIETADRGLPRHLVEGSIGFAQPLAEVNNWFVAVTGAIGYAGTSPFSDPRAVYTSDNIIVGRQFTHDQALIFALNYNGNRTFLPDCPVPGFAYANRWTPQLTYVVGLPYSSITYEPITGLQIEGGFTLLTTLEANVGYAFTKQWSLFAQYTDELSPFHLDNSNPDSRLFFHTHEAEVGIRWSPKKLIRLSVSGGWAFMQEFTDGFDSRKLIPVRHLGDSPFARVRLDIGF